MSVPDECYPEACRVHQLKYLCFESICTLKIRSLPELTLHVS
jgi:hypothetical protein